MFEGERAFGAEWWQQLASYGFTRAIDAEYAQPPKADSDDGGNIGRGSDGRYFTRGQAAPGAGVAGSMGGTENLVLIAGAVVALALVVAAMRG